MWSNKFFRKSIMMYLFLFFTLYLGAQETPVPPAAAELPKAPLPASVFLETEPSGAFVRINEEFLQETTPSFMVNLAPGEYFFDVWKEGYQSFQKKLTLKAGEVSVLKAELVKTFTPTAFPSDDKIVFNGRSLDAASTQFLLPHGQYIFERSEGITKLTPVFPDQNLWILSALGLGISALGSGAATYYDLTNPWSPRMPFSPPTLGIYSLFLGDLGWFISLTLLKMDFENHIKTQSAPAKFAPGSVQTLLELGEKAQADGNFDQATLRYQDILDYYPESSIAGEALFRLGRIHAIFGRLAQAETEYRLIITDYPLSALWDRTQKALSDLAVAQGDWDKALFHLNKIVYLDPLISLEDVQAAKDEILALKGGEK